jgi:hypothetical protein
MTTPRELEEDFLRCRANSQHRWDQIPDPGDWGRKWKQSNTVDRRAKRCTVCGTIKFECWSAVTGEILFSDYRYPNGYKMGGKYAHNRRPFRKELIRRERGKPSLRVVRRKSA